MSASSPARKLDFTLQRDPWGQLVLIDADGRRSAGVTPMRAFPISDVDHWISICDAQGHEIVCIANLERRDARGAGDPGRRIVAPRTHPRDPPHPRGDHRRSRRNGTVETDRGPSTFQINSEEDVRRLEPHQASILDSHGVRYLIRDVRRLDAASRRILDHFL